MSISLCACEKCLDLKQKNLSVGRTNSLHLESKDRDPYAALQEGDCLARIIIIFVGSSSGQAKAEKENMAKRVIITYALYCATQRYRPHQQALPVEAAWKQVHLCLDNTFCPNHLVQEGCVALVEEDSGSFLLRLW